LELTVVNEGDELLYHLTGTNFYLPINDQDLYQDTTLWKQTLPSENEQVYRGEYLAYTLLDGAKKEKWPADFEQLLTKVREQASGRYQEGYTKGIHDEDAARILQALLQISASIGLLSYTPAERSLALSWWYHFLGAEQRAELQQQLESAAVVLKVFPTTTEFLYLKTEIAKRLQHFVEQHGLFPEYLVERAAAYFFMEFTRGKGTTISQPAAQNWTALQSFLRKQKALTKFKDSLQLLQGQSCEQYLLARKWAHAFLEMQNDDLLWSYQEELACLMLFEDQLDVAVMEADLHRSLSSMRGDHAVIKDGAYELVYHDFMDRLEAYANERVPAFAAFQRRKRELTTNFRDEMQLEEFQPKVRVLLCATV